MDQRILEKAEDLFLKYGIKSVSMDDICRHIGISKKTIYQHIENKKSLVKQVITNHIEEEQKEIQSIVDASENAIEALLDIARFVLGFLKKMKPGIVYDLMKYHNECWLKIDSFHKTFIKKVIKENHEKGIAEGLYRSDLDPEIVSQFYVGNINRLMDEEFFPSSKYSYEKVYTEFVLYHLQAVVSEKGQKYLSKNVQLLN